MPLTDRGTTREEGIHALLNPQSVTIVGARDTPGSWPDRIRGNLLRFGFKGSIFGVNPRRAEIWGETCYPDLAALPEAPDHLVVVVPARAALDTVRLAAAVGARSATVFSSGFDEDEGMLEELAESAAGGMALSGPNCLGNISVPACVVTTTDSRLDEILDGPIAIVGQSGGVVTALNRVLVNRGIGARYMVSSGNETCLTTADYIRYFAGDDGIRVVVAFVESVRDRADFLDACDLLAARGKTLVALKVGRTEASRTAAASHTGALAGNFAAFEAVAAARGVVSVSSIDQAVEACEYLSRAPMPAGGKVAVVTVSGGVRELVLDGAGAHSLPLAGLTSRTRAELTTILGADVEVSNPLDSSYVGLSDANVLVRCVEAVGADDEVGLVLLQEELLGRPEDNKRRTLDLFNESFPGGATRGARVPVALFSMASFGVNDFGRRVRAELPNLAFLQGTDKALAAMSSLLRASGTPARSKSAGQDERSAHRREAAMALLAEAPEQLTEVEAKRILRLYGFETPPEAQVATPEEGRAWAEGRSGPFVVKVVSRAIAHKSDSGGVVLNLADARAVEETCSELRDRHPGLEGFLAAEQVAPSTELVVGFAHDTEMGPVVVVGAGGIAVELFGDVAFVPVPCSPDEARAAIARTKAATLLGEWRGRPAVDVRLVADAVTSMAELAAELGDVIESAEINPLVVRAGSDRALALDALLVRRPSDEKGADGGDS